VKKLSPERSDATYTADGRGRFGHEPLCINTGK